MRRPLRLVLAVLAGAALACTSTPWQPTDDRGAPVPRPHGLASGALDYSPLDPSAMQLERVSRTVESAWILHLYTALHARDYATWRVDYPGSDGLPATAHLWLPAGAGPHPAVVAFPILAGSHVVSEGLAKALVRRGYAVLRLDRRPLALERATHPREPGAAFRAALLDARRLLDWLEQRPDIDPERLAAAGVSLGGILAATLMGVDERIRAGVFIMAGAGLAEILYASTERPVRVFRDRMMAQESLGTSEDFVRFVRPWTDQVDPGTVAQPDMAPRVLLISARFDRVVPSDRTLALWEAMGRPRWLKIPSGHYQVLPFFWWSVARGADHLDRALAHAAPPPTLAER